MKRQIVRFAPTHAAVFAIAAASATLSDIATRERSQVEVLTAIDYVAALLGWCSVVALFGLLWAMRSALSQLLVPGLLVALVTALDMQLRGERLFSLLAPVDWGVYALSFALEVLLLWGIARAASGLGSARTVLLFCLALIYAVIVLGAHRFYTFFQGLPGLYSFLAVLDQSDEAAAMIAVELDAAIVVQAALFGLLVAWSSTHLWSTRVSSPRMLWGVALFLVAINFIPLSPPQAPNRTYPTLGAMLVSRERRALPFSHTSVAFAMALSRHLGGGETYAGVRSRAVAPLDPAETETDRNAILIVSESLRRHNLSVYGYQRATTPELASIAARYPQSLNLYERGYSNATLTSVSVCFLLAGIGPELGIDRLHSSHLVHEYVGTLANIRPAYIPSWTYHTSGYGAFINPASVDRFYSRETEDLPIVCDLGIDDKHVVRQFERFLAGLDDGAHFFAVLHLSNTHYPYYAPAGSAPWESSNLLDRYDSSVFYQDRQIGRIFEILEARGELTNTLIAFTADHGEGLGINRPRGHGGPQDRYSIGVPIWIFAPTGEQFARERELLKQAAGQNVCNADIGPTLLDFLGFEPEKLGLTRPGLLSGRGRDLPIFLYDWRMGFISNQTDYLAIVIGDHLMNATYEAGQTTYHLTRLVPPYRRGDWSSASDSIRTPFAAALSSQTALPSVFKRGPHVQNR